MRLNRLQISLVALLAATTGAFGQAAILQAGPTTPGHFPVYVGRGQQQPMVKDGGTSGGGSLGTNPGDLGITSWSPTGTYPVASGGKGPFGEHFCMYDSPTDSSSGYHYLCLDPNAQGGGVLSYGAGGVASQLPFNFIVNGVKRAFPFTSFTITPNLQIFDPRTSVPAAKCDGSTDDYLAFVATERLAEAANGGAVLVPDTGHTCLISHGLALGNGVGVVGVGGSVNPGAAATIAQWAQAGSWLQSTDTANGTIIGQGSGNFVNGVNFIRAQPIPSSSAGVAYTPNTYKYEIDLQGSFSWVNNVKMIGVSNGVSLDYTQSSGGGTYTWLSHLDIDAMGAAFQTSNVNDTVYVNDVHARSYFNAGNSNLITYREANAIGWDMHYTDNLMMDSFECFQTASCIAATDQQIIIGGNPVTHSGYNLQIVKLDCNLVVTCINLAVGSTFSGRISEIIAQQDTGYGFTSALFALPSNTVDLQIGSLNVVTTGGSVMSVGAGSAGNVAISTLNLGTNVGGTTLNGYSTNATNQPAFTLAAGAAVSIGQRKVLRATTAGAFASGAGAANLVMPMTCWTPFSVFDQASITGTNATATFTTDNYTPTTSLGKFLQVRMLAQPRITTTQTGTITLQLQNFPNDMSGSAISLTFPANVSGYPTLGDTNWRDVNDAGTIFGRFQQNSPTGEVFTFGDLTACGR